jgi:uncharacterized protein (TIGR01370 family)
MKTTAFLLLLLQLSALAQVKNASPCSIPLGDVETYAVVYYANRSLDQLARFNMVVLDPANYDSTDIAKLKSMGCIPIAYLNVGEIETYRGYFSLVDTSMMLSPDPNWRDRYYVDLCNPAWERIVMQERIPEVMRKGFCGVFVDFAGALDEYPDMDSCAVSFVRQVRRVVGNGDIIADGVRPIIQRIGNYIDGIAVEGLMGYYDFQTDSYRLRNDSLEDRESTTLLAEAKKFKLTVFQLDYAPPTDSKTRDNIIIRSRQIGFVPYVGTIELDTLFTNTIRKINLPEGSTKKFPD